MKYFFVILLLSLSLVSLATSELVYGESDDFRFVELNDSYFLGDKITIKFEKVTQQPCPSYEISMMKKGFPESMINVGVEPLCATLEPVKPYLFSDDLEKSELFNSVGTYIIKVKLDDEIIQKEIKITDNKNTSPKEFDGFFTVNEKQVRYVIPYTISNGTLNDMTLYCEHASLLVKITPQTEYDGMLVLDFPRSIMDPKTNDEDGRFIVLRDDDEIDYDEIPYPKYRKLSIPFVADTQEIEIVQTFILTSKPEMCKVAHEPPYSSILPPLKQIKSGIDADKIICKESMMLVTKYDGSPACVKPVTKQHLTDRNWGETKSLDEIEHNSKLIKQNIIRIEDGFISLYPENMCASITLGLPTEEDIQRYASDEKGLGDGTVLQITDKDLKEIPIIQELIYAAHSIEFPYNKHSSAYLDGLTFVEYEFFLMEKAIEKYGDLQGDYFIRLDNDYEQRFANPAKQGFTNHFESPVIVYNDAAYSVSGTNFWTSDEHEPRRMSIFPIDGIKGDEKFIILTDEDMKSVPEIKEAIESIGTIQESISANKGLPEPQWNEYREWFEQKSQDRLNADRFRLMQYDGQLYSIGFGIC